MRKLILILAVLPLISFGQSPICKESKISSYLKGTLEWEIIKSYDGSGNIVEQIQNNLTNNGSYTNRKTYQYDAKGRESVITEYHNGVLLQTLTKEYDGKGKLIREVASKNGNQNPLNSISVLANSREQLFFESDGKVSGREVQEFDSAGKLTKKELRGAENQLYQSVENVYDNAGKITYIKRNDVVGNMIEETATVYDNQGNVLSDSTIINGKVSAYTQYNYENNKLIKKTRLKASKSVEYVIDYVNNSQGLPIEERFVYNNNVISMNKYFYDTNGNKIKQEDYDGGNILIRNKTWAYVCN